MSAPEDPRVKALADAAQVIAHQLDIALRRTDPAETRPKKLASMLEPLATARGKRSQERTRNLKRAAELKAEGHPPYRIAQIMTDERNAPRLPPIAERSVRRWLAKAKSRTD